MFQLSLVSFASFVVPATAFGGELMRQEYREQLKLGAKFNSQSKRISVDWDSRMTELQLSTQGSGLKLSRGLAVIDTEGNAQLMKRSSDTPEKRKHAALPALELQEINGSVSWGTACSVAKQNRSLARFADKAGVKDYIRAKNLGIGIIKTFFTVLVESDITMDKLQMLPSRFVMKGTHGSGMTVVANLEQYKCISRYCKYEKPQNESKLAQLQFLRDSCKAFLGIKYNSNTEKYYSEITPRCIFEEFLVEHDDWKIHTLHGTPMLIQVDTGRDSEHKQTYYTPSWHKVKLSNFNKGPFLPTLDIPLPAQLPQLLKVASELGSDFDHLRVDLYINNGTVYFGELTNTPLNCQKWRPQIVDQYFGYVVSVPGARRVPDDILSLLDGVPDSERTGRMSS